nr:uncharacterized protein LOC115496794 isoform X2 [Taeniopygia guttata]
MSTWLHLLGARSHPGNRLHLSGQGKATFLPGQRRALRAGLGRRTGSEGVTKPKELDIGAILSGWRSWGIWLQAPLSGLRGAGDRKGPGFVRQPGHGRYIWKPNKLVWKRPFPRSQQRQASCMAGQRLPQPRRRLRGSERGELRPARGQRGRLARLCQRQCRPRQREPCPRPSRELEREIGESWRAPAGAVRRESCNRAEEDAEMLVSTAVQHRNISASLKQRGYYMGGSTEHFWAGKVSSCLSQRQSIVNHADTSGKEQSLLQPVSNKTFQLDHCIRALQDRQYFFIFRVK